MTRKPRTLAAGDRVRVIGAGISDASGLLNDCHNIRGTVSEFREGFNYNVGVTLDERPGAYYYFPRRALIPLVKRKRRSWTLMHVKCADGVYRTLANGPHIDEDKQVYVVEAKPRKERKP